MTSAYAVLANVLDRVREIGVLRAIGMLRTQVRRMVVLESTFVGLVGGLVGVAVGTAIACVSMRFIIGADRLVFAVSVACRTDTSVLASSRC